MYVYTCCVLSVTEHLQTTATAYGLCTCTPPIELPHESLYYLHYNVTLSHLRSKEVTGIHKSCIPHSRDTTKCKPVSGLHSDVARESGCTSNMHNTFIQD